MTYEAWLTISPPGYGEQVSVSLSKPSDVLVEQGYDVRRMVEAPPEAAPTYAELTDALRWAVPALGDALSKLESQVARCPDLPKAYGDILRVAYAHHRILDALLSRIPQHPEGTD